MFRIIRENVRDFLDAAVFMTMIAIGLFSILSDYRYFKRVKFPKDAASALGVGLAYLLLPFALLLIAKL